MKHKEHELQREKSEFEQLSLGEHKEALFRYFEKQGLDEDEVAKVIGAVGLHSMEDALELAQRLTPGDTWWFENAKHSDAMLVRHVDLFKKVNQRHNQALDYLGEQNQAFGSVSNQEIDARLDDIEEYYVYGNDRLDASRFLGSAIDVPASVQNQINSYYARVIQRKLKHEKQRESKKGKRRTTEQERVKSIVNLASGETLSKGIEMGEWNLREAEKWLRENLYTQELMLWLADHHAIGDIEFEGHTGHEILKAHWKRQTNPHKLPSRDAELTNRFLRHALKQTNVLKEDEYLKDDAKYIEQFIDTFTQELLYQRSVDLHRVKKAFGVGKENFTPKEFRKMQVRPEAGAHDRIDAIARRELKGELRKMIKNLGGRYVLRQNEDTELWEIVKEEEDDKNEKLAKKKSKEQKEQSKQYYVIHRPKNEWNSIPDGSKILKVDVNLDVDDLGIERKVSGEVYNDEFFDAIDDSDLDEDFQWEDVSNVLEIVSYKPDLDYTSGHVETLEQFEKGNPTLGAKFRDRIRVEEWVERKAKSINEYQAQVEKLEETAIFQVPTRNISQLASGNVIFYTLKKNANVAYIATIGTPPPDIVRPLPVWSDIAEAYVIADDYVGSLDLVDTSQLDLSDFPRLDVVKELILDDLKTRIEVHKESDQEQKERNKERELLPIEELFEMDKWKEVETLFYTSLNGIREIPGGYVQYATESGLVIQDKKGTMVVPNSRLEINNDRGYRLDKVKVVDEDSSTLAITLVHLGDKQTKLLLYKDGKILSNNYLASEKIFDFEQKNDSRVTIFFRGDRDHFIQIDEVDSSHFEKSSFFTDGIFMPSRAFEEIKRKLEFGEGGYKEVELNFLSKTIVIDDGDTRQCLDLGDAIHMDKSIIDDQRMVIVSSNRDGLYSITCVPGERGAEYTQREGLKNVRPIKIQGEIVGLYNYSDNTNENYDLDGTKIESLVQNERGHWYRPEGTIDSKRAHFESVSSGVRDIKKLKGSLPYSDDSSSRLVLYGDDYVFSRYRETNRSVIGNKEFNTDIKGCIMNIQYFEDHMTIVVERDGKMVLLQRDIYKDQSPEDIDEEPREFGDDIKRRLQLLNTIEFGDKNDLLNYFVTWYDGDQIHEDDDKIDNRMRHTLKQRYKKDGAFFRSQLRDMAIKKPENHLLTFQAQQDTASIAQVDYFFKILYPDLAQREQEKYWEEHDRRAAGFGKKDKGCNFNTSEQHNGMFGVDTDPTSMGGNPRAEGKELISSREPIEESLIVGAYGKWNDSMGRFDHSKMPHFEPQHTVGQQKTRTMDVEGLSQVQIPTAQGGRILVDRVKGIQFDDNFEAVEVNVHVEHTEDGRVIADLRKQSDVAEIVYSETVPMLPPIPHHISQDEYRGAIKTFEKRYGNDMTTTLPVDLPEHWYDFLQGIEKLTPQQKLVAIQKFVQDHCFYDRDNKDVALKKSGKCLQDQLEIASYRAKELGVEADFAGVCHDTANITCALLREAGFASGYVNLFVGKGRTTLKSNNYHAAAWVAWPHEQVQGAFKMILVDGTPSSDPGMPENIQLPDIESLLEHREQLQEQVVDQAREQVQEMLQQLRSGGVESLKTLKNGTLEQSVNTLLLAAKQQNYKVFERLLAFARYSGFDLSDTQAVTTEAESIIFQLKKEGHEKDEGAGTRMMVLFEDYIRRYRQDHKGDKDKAIDALQEIVSILQTELSEDEQLVATAILQFLRAKGMTGK